MLVCNTRRTNIIYLNARRNEGINCIIYIEEHKTSYLNVRNITHNIFLFLLLALHHLALHLDHLGVALLLLLGLDLRG